jgi:hypothetical protein
LSRETGEMTRLYEDARYGKHPDPMSAGRMCELYRKIFRHLRDA